MMAVVRLKCTVCKREIEIPENRKGLEIVNNCIITDKCRGKLYRTERLQDYIRGKFPSRVAGLDDYTPRRVLYNHTQAVASTQWFVEHNLGVVPAVEVLINIAAESEDSLLDTPCVLRSDVSNFTQVETTDFTINITGSNTLTITFDDPVSGIAQCIARSSAPVVSEEAIDMEVPTLQLTASGSELTIATLNETIPSSNTLHLTFVYDPPGDALPISYTYAVGSSPSTISPWTDLPPPRTVLIEGNQYKVRSFNAFIPEMANGTIPDGSSFYLSGIDDGTGNSPLPREVSAEEIFILLALSPYEPVDKIVDNLVDLGAVDASNAQASFFHQDRELFAFETVLLSTFPPVREIS
jgi:hypothetical protein